jgi:hypothetical protein
LGVIFQESLCAEKQLQPFWTKYYSRILPVGVNLKRRRHSDGDLCPCCGECEEHDHIMQFTHPEMESAFQGGVELVQQFLHNNMDDQFGQDILILL